MNRTFYITTPIYYPSGRLHIGHAYTTVAADFIARYKRMCGFDTRFLTGTDEHGIKIQRAATKAGIPPQEFVDRAYAGISELWKTLEISYDDFIRTTEPRHKQAVQTIFERVRERGDIYKGVYEGWYCADCESFFLERQLVEGKCPDCGRQVELLREDAYFFRLSSYADRLLAHIEEHPEFIQPQSRRNEMVSFIRSGLEDLCVSRTSFSWGIPVPGDPSHVIYVWFDALSNYITALGYGSDDDFDRYWPADVHLMGKEIVRFHSIIWPIILMALDLPLPGQVFGHGWLVLGGEKISKSRGNVIDPQVLAQKYGLDAVRYFLLREVPFVADGNYSEDALVRRTNTDLANDLGNLLHRTLAMVERFSGGKVPQPDGQTQGDARPLVAAAREALAAYEQHIEKLELANALSTVLGLVNRANKYIEEQSPWDLAKDPDKVQRLNTVLYDLLETLRISAVLLAPALTRAPAGILQQIGWQGDVNNLRLPEAAQFGQLQPGSQVSRGRPLFPRIEDEKTGEGDSEEAATPAPAAKLPQEAPQRVTIDDFRRIDLRVARVIAADRVQGADKLLALRVQLADGERQIVAGIAAHYGPDQVVGKDIVIVANLEPAKIRGLVSDGMLLAASGDGRLVLVGPESPMPPGSRVS